DLYQELILDHTRKPRNFGPLDTANRQAEGFNPLCGDRVTVTLHLEAGRVCDIHFEGSGCAISTASASLMTEAVKGKAVAEVEALFKRVHGLLTGQPESQGTDLGKLVALGGVREFPMRVKCATLPWHTLAGALDDNPASLITTE
ncbi:MAG: SUF system NifU family Fe-S cluster assembly protein, partial [Myxococcota bacterium]